MEWVNSERDVMPITGFISATIVLHILIKSWGTNDDHLVVQKSIRHQVISYS